jgi:hypothetical protein
MSVGIELRDLAERLLPFVGLQRLLGPVAGWVVAAVAKVDLPRTGHEIGDARHEFAPDNGPVESHERRRAAIAGVSQNLL